MNGVYEIDILGAVFLKRKKNLRKFFIGHFFSDVLPAYFVVLAKDTAKRTACKKDCTRAVFTADNRLFPEVFCGARNARKSSAFAETSGDISVYSAFSRTQFTFFVIHKKLF